MLCSSPTPGAAQAHRNKLSAAKTATISPALTAQLHLSTDVTLPLILISVTSFFVLYHIPKPKDNPFLNHRGGIISELQEYRFFRNWQTAFVSMENRINPSVQFNHTNVHKQKRLSETVVSESPWSECNYRISKNTDISTVCWQSARGIYSKNSK